MTGLALWLVTLGALGAAAWAGFLALSEEGAVEEALHALGEAPTPGRDRRVPLHRVLHLARVGLLAVAGVLAGVALQWWTATPAHAAWSLAAAIGFVFVVADAVPRSVARVAPEIADAALPIARRTLAPFVPLVALMVRLDRKLYRLLAEPRTAESAVGPAHRDVLLGIFSLADTTVEDVMTPRLDMAAVDVAAPLGEIVDAFRSSEHTRLPVSDGTPDSIMGVIYAKDLIPLALGTAGPDAPARWQDLIRPAVFVPPTKTLDAQLRDFQRGTAHLAIVVDEFGGTAGLVTVTDILEEVMGTLPEAAAGEAPPIERDGDRFWVDGRLGLAELSEALGAPLTHPEVSTVGGLIYSVLGRVPHSGEELTLDGFRVVVEKVVRRRVSRVYFERQP